MVTGIRAPPRLGRYVRPVVDALDLRQVELELCRLPEVTAARIVEDDVGRPVEVHILATREKHPKQIVRDVQSVSMATFGLDIDRRVISVVQLEGGSGDEAVVSSNGANGSGGGRGGGPARVVIGGIDVQKRQVRCNVRVTLEQGGEEAVGEAEGSIAASSRPRLVAAATLDALRELVPAVDAADVDAAQIVRVGARDIAVSSIVFVTNPPFEETSSGSAPVREAGASGEHEAIARSVLSALNRRLPHL
jgi:hypothetical protein